MLRARWRTFIRPPLIPPLVVMGTVALISLAAAQLAVAAPLLGSVRRHGLLDGRRGAREPLARHPGSPPQSPSASMPAAQFTGRACHGRAAARVPSVTAG